MVLALRVADLANHPQGKKLLDQDASGAVGKWVRTRLPEIAATKLENIEQVLISLPTPFASPPWENFVVRFREPVGVETIKQAWPRAEAEKVGVAVFYRSGNDAFHLPAADSGSTMVVASVKNMRDVLAAGGQSAFLPPDTESLVRRFSNRENMFTLIVCPNRWGNPEGTTPSLPAERLRTALNWFLTGRNAGQAMATPPAPAPRPHAMLMSGHLGDDFFAEIVISPDAEPATQVAAIADRIRQLPRMLRRAVLRVRWTPDTEEPLVELQDIFAELAQHTQIEAGDGSIRLHCEVPSPAVGYNLVRGSYLYLEALPNGMSPRSVSARLKQKVTLSFPRNTLEKSMKMMSKELGVPITIMGGDLQLEGITKNQSFGLDERNVPAIDVFLKILKLANPDGKLVYIIKSKEGGGEEILLTTRAAVAKRGDKLPPELEQAPAKKK